MISLLYLVLLFSFLSLFGLVIGLFPPSEARPTLRAFQPETSGQARKPKKPFEFLRKGALIAKPLVSGPIRQRLNKDLAKAHVGISPEEFMLAKCVMVLGFMFIAVTFAGSNMPLIPVFFISALFGYMLPEWWLRGKIGAVKNMITRDLPDAIDLLGLCVNAGLDFMLALKWVVEKSPPSAMVNQLNTLLQEVNVGKTRRDALKDLASKYDIPDLSTFSRTLIQADKMGTSVSEALNLLSEDMRLARFRRGEQIAMKAPMKLLVPLLFCIFPVVFILVAGPIVLQFVQENPLEKLGR